MRKLSRSLSTKFGSRDGGGSTSAPQLQAQQAQQQRARSMTTGGSGQQVVFNEIKRTPEQLQKQMEQMMREEQEMQREYEQEQRESTHTFNVSEVERGAKIGTVITCTVHPSALVPEPQTCHISAYNASQIISGLHSRLRLAPGQQIRVSWLDPQTGWRALRTIKELPSKQLLVMIEAAEESGGGGGRRPAAERGGSGNGAPAQPAAAVTEAGGGEGAATPATGAAAAEEQPTDVQGQPAAAGADAAPTEEQPADADGAEAESAAMPAEDVEPQHRERSASAPAVVEQ